MDQAEALLHCSALAAWPPQKHLGTVEKVSWNSEAFGSMSATAASGYTYNLRFPGQYYDVETKKHYNYFRDYDPAIGRYLQSDPIGLGGGVNTYGYVGGDPVRYLDSKGESAAALPAAAAGAGAVCLAIPSCRAAAERAAKACIDALPYVLPYLLPSLWHPPVLNEGPKSGDGGSSSDPDAPPQPDEIPTIDWNDPTKPPVGPDGEEWVWRGKPPQGGDKGGYVNPSNPDQSVHPDLHHPDPVGPHWDYTDRNKTNPGWRVYPDGTIENK